MQITRSGGRSSCIRGSTKELLLDLLSPRNAVRWGYRNAAVVLSVHGYVRPCMDLVNTIETTPLLVFFVKLGRHVNHGERINPVEFGGQRSKVKVTIDIHGNKLANTIETKLLCASWSNLAGMLAMVRGWTLFILEVKGHGHNGHIWT